MRTSFSLAAMAALAAGLSAHPAAARALWLSDSELRAAFEGKTLEGAYAQGRRFTERYLAGGKIEYSEDGMQMSGHWSVAAGTLCTFYDDGMSGGCFRVARSAANCFTFHFAATDEANAKETANQRSDWTAVGSTSASPDTCPENSDV